MYDAAYKLIIYIKSGDFMKKLYAYVIAAVFSMTITTAAIADGLSGFSVGLIANHSTFTTTGSEIETIDRPGGKEETHGSVKESAAFPAIFAEYTAMSSFGVGVTAGVIFLNESFNILIKNWKK